MNKNCADALCYSEEFGNLSEEERNVILNIVHFKGNLEDIRYADVFLPQENPQNEGQTIQSPKAIEYKDKRIKSICFYNFRTYFKATDKPPYGLSLSKGANPCSLFLMGANGTGKSTIFSALEYYYSGRCSHAVEMQCDPIEYLTYGFGRVRNATDDDVALTVERQDVIEDKIKLRSMSPVCPPVSFCSDYDVDCIKSNGKKMYDYLLQQLGYQDLAKALIGLGKVRDVLTEAKANFSGHGELSSNEFMLVVNEILNRKDSLDRMQAEIKDYSNQAQVLEKPIQQPVLFEDQWSILDKYINQPTLSQNNLLFYEPQIGKTDSEDKKQKEFSSECKSQADKISRLYRKLDEIISYYKDSLDQGIITYPGVVEDLINQKKKLEQQESSMIMGLSNENDYDVKINMIEKCRVFIENQRQRLVDKFVSDYKQEIQGILSQYSVDGELYEMKTVAGKLNVTVKVYKEETSEFNASVFEYLNTFRFKLFCLLFKICLSFYWMKLNKTIVPVVIDDVFNANDFDNRLKLEQFVYRVYKIYDLKLQRNTENCNIPLQLIMLTHDDVVLSSFKKGYLYMSEKDFMSERYVRTCSNHMICGRLLSCRQADEWYMLQNVEETYKNLYADGLL